MPCRLLLPLFLLAAILLAPVRTAHAQLTIEELELYFKPSGTPESARTFRVRNDNARVVQAAIAIEDWDRAEDGVNRFYQAGSMPRSCAAMLRVFPRSLRLEPGASANVRVALEGADSLKASCWSIVLVESRDAPDSIGRQLTYTVRTGVKVYVEPQGLPRDGQVEELSIFLERALSERQVRRNRVRQYDTLRFAVFGDQHNARFDRVTWRFDLHGTAVDLYRARTDGIGSCNCTNQFGPACPDNAGDSKNLAGVDRKAHVREGTVWGG
jgi:P pilus assembly chaperone PapD